MKSLVVLCLVFVAVCGLPAKKTDYDDSDESFFLFPMGRQHKKEVPSVVEVEVGDSDEDTSFFPAYFRPLFINPFSFMNFGFSDFFSKPSWFDSLLPKGIPDDAIKNSTSSTKVVDGHKITVNETTYENEKNGAVYRFQIINISPVDSKEEGEKPAEKQPEQTEGPEQPAQPDTRIQTTENVKPDQNSQDNEIHREEEKETLLPQMSAHYELLQGDDPSAYDKNVEMIDVNNHPGKSQNVDISSDIRVNTLLAENSRRGGLFMVPPDVEVFDTLDYEALSANYQQQPSDAQEIVKPNFNQETIRPQYNQVTVRPQYNQETVRPQYNQETVRSQYNQETVRSQYNQGVVPAQYNQETIRSQYNQGTIPPHYNQGTIPPHYNQETIRPQYNQDTVRSQYNQGTIRPQYNQETVRSQYNQGVVPTQYNQDVARPQYNQ